LISKIGLLTNRQIEILKMRNKGLTQEAISLKLKTTRENISIIEKRANRNIKLAQDTLSALKTFGVSFSIFIKPGTNLVDIPRIIFDKSDESNIKVKANFTQIFEEIRFKAYEKVRRLKVIKPITIKILPDGDFTVEQ